MKNWKTTVSGIIFAAALFVTSSGLAIPSWLWKTIKGLEALAVVCLGTSAKDFDVDAGGKP